MTSIQDYMHRLGQRARTASTHLRSIDSHRKNQALTAIASAVDDARQTIVRANEQDLHIGERNGLDAALLDRLALDSARIDAMIDGVQQVVALPDPCGELSELRYRPSGIQVGKMRVPLGVIGIIYESRPNVTLDAASLCLKSGNAAILRGGSEAIHSNQALAACIEGGLANAGVSTDMVQVVDTVDRQAVTELITMTNYVDVVVPRGGKSLIERIAREAKVNVIKHLDGICHVYIDGAADLDKALAIAVNSKAHRFGVCNAMETLLVAEAVAAKILPPLASAYRAKGVELRGCERTCALIDAQAATDTDWETEYLAPVLSVRVVANIDAAIAHIQRYSSRHTDAIVTENYTLARRFLTEVDSSSVMVNASTRFADGFEYGLGAEIGISTDTIHVRGPVGLEGLTSQKWVVLGDGQIRV